MIKIRQQDPNIITIEKAYPQYVYLANLFSLTITFFIGVILLGIGLNTPHNSNIYFGGTIFCILWSSSIIFSTFKSSYNIICYLDKHLNQITVKYSEEKSCQHCLEEITDCRIEEKQNAYRISFLLNSETILPLTYIYTSEYKKQQEIIERIKQFLNLE